MLLLIVYLDFKRNKYDIVICQLGGNDISIHNSPCELNDTFVDFVSYMRNTYYVKETPITKVITCIENYL